MIIMPPPQPYVCEMALNGEKDCVVVESLRCPYCLAAVEIRQGDNWTTYWCSKHGPIESPLSFSVSADVSPHPGSPISRVSAFSRRLYSPAGGGLFIESSRMCLAAMMPFRVTSLIAAQSGASREGLKRE